MVNKASRGKVAAAVGGNPNGTPGDKPQQADVINVGLIIITATVFNLW